MRPLVVISSILVSTHYILPIKSFNLKKPIISVHELVSKLRFDHIETAYRNAIIKIISAYHITYDIFSFEDDPLPCSNLSNHSITLHSEKPINIKSYRIPDIHKLEIQIQVNEMLKKSKHRKTT